MFSQFSLDTDNNIFNTLSTVTEFEDICTGRKGANLITFLDEVIPLVRTTTKYNNPPQKFLPIHEMLMDKIRAGSPHNDTVNFNNAMIEIYDHSYTKMGFHTDQSLDLQRDSFICIFSCYSDPTTPHVRKLEVKHKVTGEKSTIMLTHGSCVMFSLNTNFQYVHKIILDTKNPCDEWLGMTLRLSKTFIHFRNEIPYFYQTETILHLANEEERKEFIKYKGLENKTVWDAYPELYYTTSPSDLIQIK